MRRLAILSACLLALARPARLAAEDWPQFRGHNGSGISTSKGLPEKFSFKEKVLWEATLGDGIG